MNQKPPEVRKATVIALRVTAAELRKVIELQKRTGARNRSDALRALLAVEVEPRKAA